MRYIATLIVLLSSINLATSCVLDPPPPPQPKVVPQPTMPPMPPEPEPKKATPKKPAINSSACPGEIDNKDITDAFKGFSYKDYLKSATSQKTDPVLGSMNNPYTRYKGKNGIVYDVYAIKHDQKNDLTPLVDIKKLKAGTLQRLNKIKGKCVYYTEISPSQTDGASKDKHAEVILLFYKSPDQKYTGIEGSNTVDSVAQALDSQSKPAKSSSKKVAKSSDEDDDMDEEEEDDATKEDDSEEDDSDEDSLSSKKSSAKVDEDDDSDEGSFDFGSSDDDDEDDEDDDSEDDSDEE